MLLAELVATSAAVAATRSRKAKVAALAELLGRVEPEELEVVVSYLGGTLRQRRTGLGWRGVSDLPAPADEPSLTVLEVHDAFEAMSHLSGAGSQRARKEAAAQLFGRATAAEQAWLRAIVTGNVRQGALDAVTQEAVAQVADVPLAAVRRAAMLAGSTVAAAGAAFEGEEALDGIGLEVGRPIMPMLASSAPDVAAAMAGLSPDGETEVAIDAKLDGIRIQVHRDGDEVLVVHPQPRRHHRAAARGGRGRPLAARRAVRARRRGARPDRRRAPDGLPGHRQPHRPGPGVAVTPHFFDLLHVDGRDLLDAPGHERLDGARRARPGAAPRAAASSPPTRRPPTRSPPRPSPRVTRASCSRTSRRPTPPGVAARRGSRSSRVHTLDLVVLAVEWGSGRRQGWLSNIHLGARDESPRPAS